MYAEWRLPAKPKMKPTPIVLYNGDFLMQEDNPSKRVTRPHLDAGDSGLLFRGTSKCQANIWSQELGSGEINGYRTDKKMPQKVRRACIPIKKADRPLGEWNAFLVTIKGDRMTVDLNGERVIDAAELPGLPKSGPIGSAASRRPRAVSRALGERAQIDVRYWMLDVRCSMSTCGTSFVKHLSSSIEFSLLDLLRIAELFLSLRHRATILAAEIARLCRADRFVFLTRHERFLVGR